MSTADRKSEQKTPDELRGEIDETREQLGDTVEALAAKTDVKGQAKERIVGIKQGAQHKKEEFKARAKEATSESAGVGAQQFGATIQRRPAPFAAAGAFAAGLLVGWFLWRR